MPDIDDEATDATRQARLAQALALMLLAHHAVKAGFAERRWGRFGKAVEVAAAAVARQPLQIYLRFEQAEILRMLQRWDEAFAAMRDARPLATDLAARFRLADTAGEIAAQASDAAEGGNAALLEAAEREFFSPLFATGTDDGPAVPPRDDTAARDWAWWVAFRGGKVALARARFAPEGGVEAARLAERAARRFARALALMDEAATPVRGEHRANLVEWRRQALRDAAERHLAAGLAREAAGALAAMGTAEHAAMAGAIERWLAAGRPPRFAAAALVGHSHADAAAQLAFPALAAATRGRSDGAENALPPIAEPVVVEVNDPLLMDEALAHAIIGGQEEPTIGSLRERMRARFRFRLPGVRLRGVDDPEAPRRITVLFTGMPDFSVTAPAGARLALAAAQEARLAGLTPLPGEAPTVNGVTCTWVAAPASSAVVALRDPAYAIVGTLETALLRALPRLIGLDDAAAIIPGIEDEALPRALAALRLLFADRTAIDDAMVDHLRRGLVAGDAPAAIVGETRLLPGMRALLWGNEGARRAVRPGRALVGSLQTEAGPGLSQESAEAVAALIGPSRHAVLLVDLPAERAAIRAALSRPPKALDWLADIPVLAEGEWAGAS
jgi:hypothetical protein